MSQEVAFGTEAKESVFNFSEEKSEEAFAPASLAETDTEEQTQSSSEDKQEDVEEQKVPYSRFKKVIEEREEVSSKVSMLEERLAQLESARSETKEEVDVPEEWTKLYGNSDIAKEAWTIQSRREEQLQEAAVERAIERIQESQKHESEALVENESIIDDNLAKLEEQVGRKLSPKIEEAILSVVDEFSPVGSDGKYISLFPFEKAYEIYELRQSKNGQATRNARASVASLSSDTSTGDAETSGTEFKRGWDGWRAEL